MSFEGYTQVFCTKGHYYESGEGYYNDIENCSCGAKPALVNLVDDTNCDDYGVIPPKQLETLLLEPEKIETCNLGHRHVTKEAVYRIPTQAEVEQLSHYWDGGDQTFIPLRKP